MKNCGEQGTHWLCTEINHNDIINVNRQLICVWELLCIAMNYSREAPRGYYKIGSETQRERGDMQKNNTR